MRPRSIDEFAGQEHFLGSGKLLRRMLEADRIASAIFYGPPGTGKTSLAQVIARQTRREFVPLNAASAGVKELRTALDEARDRLAADSRPTILFVDELHRFNRTQQEVLLPDVEAGVVASDRRDDGQSLLFAGFATGQPQPGLRVSSPFEGRRATTARTRPRRSRTGIRLRSGPRKRAGTRFSG
ncbi:MAG TPA: AAA family ATPase [Pirellulales bacterium]|nr:AAA family ATPase [Pirellulales bacterium]